MAEAEARFDDADAHASGAQAHVDEVKGASGAVAQDEVAKTPPPK